MGYADESRQGFIVPQAVALDAIATQTPATKALFRVLRPCTVYGIHALVTTAMTVTAAVVDFDRRITPGSDTGRIDQGVGRLTIPTTLAIGNVSYKDVTVDLNAGDEIVLELVTASTAGAAVFGMDVVARHEVPANQADMVASV